MPRIKLKGRRWSPAEGGGGSGGGGGCAQGRHTGGGGCNSTNGFIHLYCIFRSAQDVYLFLLDILQAALETGYLRDACVARIDELERLRGDGRNVYQVPEGATHATQLIVRDVANVFLPLPSDLLANLGNWREQVVNMLVNLPEHFNSSQ